MRFRFICSVSSRGSNSERIMLADNLDAGFSNGRSGKVTDPVVAAKHGSPAEVNLERVRARTVAVMAAQKAVKAVAHAMV